MGWNRHTASALDAEAVGSRQRAAQLDRQALNTADPDERAAIEWAAIDHRSAASVDAQIAREIREQQG